MSRKYTLREVNEAMHEARTEARVKQIERSAKVMQAYQDKITLLEQELAEEKAVVVLKNQIIDGLEHDLKGYQLTTAAQQENHQISEKIIDETRAENVRLVAEGLESQAVISTLQAELTHARSGRA